MQYPNINNSINIPMIPGSSKKVWQEELDTPVPPISMLCDSSAWRNLHKKNSHSCSGHGEAMVSNIETKVWGLPVDVETFWSMAGCFS